MDETVRLLIVTLGASGILAYLLYLACTEHTFNRRR